MFEPGLFHYLVLSAALFCIGLFGVMVSKNLIRIFMCIELMLNAANINFAAFAYFCDGDSLSGHLFIIFVMALAVCELAVGLVVLIALSRHSKSVEINDQNFLEDER